MITQWSGIKYYDSMIQTIDDGDDYTNTTQFIIPNVIKCEVTQVLNGIYQCYFECPEVFTGNTINKIKPSHYIELDLNNYYFWGTTQRFIIYDIERKNGVMCVTAYHISYQLSWDAPDTLYYFDNQTYTTILNKFSSWVENNTGFTFSNRGGWGDTRYTYEVTEIKSLYAVMMDFMNARGGVWEFNQKACRITAPRERDIIFRYDSELYDIVAEADVENSYARATGRYLNEDGTSVKGSILIGSQYSYVNNVPRTKTAQFDLTGEFTSPPSNSSPIVTMLENMYSGQEDEVRKLKYDYDYTIIPNFLTKSLDYMFYIGDIIYIQVMTETSPIPVQIREIKYDPIRQKIISIKADKITSNNDLFYNLSNVSMQTIKEDKTKYVIISQYSYDYTVSANGNVNISATNFGASVPDGYKAVAVGRIATGSTSVVMRAFNYKATTSSAMLSMINTSASSVSATATIEIMYFKKAAVTS